MGPVIAQTLRTKNKHLIEEIITLTGNSLINRIKHIPEVAAHPGAWDTIVAAGRLAYADAYRYVYYVSIGELMSSCTDVKSNAWKCLVSLAWLLRAFWGTSKSTWTIMLL
jgi:hypothetical protein